MAFFGHLNSKVMELQRQLAQDHGQFAVLNSEVDKTLDKLKHFESTVNGQVMEAHTNAQVAAAKATDVETDLHTLKGKIENVIMDLNGHIGGSFSAVEEEFRKLQQHLMTAGPYTDGSARSSGDNNGALAYSVENLATTVNGYAKDSTLMKLTVDGLRIAVNGLISEMGPDGCHCKHVDTLAQEIKDTTNKLNAFNVPRHDARIVALE